jgi:hypothetical protein
MNDVAHWLVGIGWFFLIAALIGVAMVPLIRWYNNRTPIKDPEEDKIKLHLND